MILFINLDNYKNRYLTIKSYTITCRIYYIPNRCYKVGTHIFALAIFRYSGGEMRDCRLPMLLYTPLAHLFDLLDSQYKVPLCGSCKWHSFLFRCPKTRVPRRSISSLRIAWQLVEGFLSPLLKV